MNYQCVRSYFVVQNYWQFFGCLFTITLLVNPVSALFSSASFYGDSFIFQRLSDFSSDSIITIQFQTRLPDGVIFAAVGQEDYFAVILRHGRLEVHVCASSGEGVLKSPQGVRYDNQLWHNVDVFRIGSRIDLRVNSKDVISEKVGKTSTDGILNIDLGVFLGGYDVGVVAADHFDLSVPFFRGCILTAVFNTIDVLHPLYSTPNEKVVHNIKAGCSRILRTRSVEPMKITSQYAYLKYQRWTDETEGTFECHLKSRDNHGLILFNSGWEKQAFVGLEMIAGRIRASVNTGAGAVGLQSTKAVNDGKWHRIRFSFSPSLLEIRVDRNRTKVFIEHDNGDGASEGNNDIRLKGPLYIGGVETSIRNHRSLQASGLQLRSFRGCLKNIRVNYKHKTLSHILASHDVIVGCASSQSNATILSPPKPPSLPTFIIVPRPPALPADKVIKPVEEEDATIIICHSLQLRNATIEEGGSINVTSDIIALQQINRSPPMLSDGLLFTIQLTELPRHGQLFIDRDVASRNKSYFMDIIYENKLSYDHDGSETNWDSFSFSLDFAAGKQLNDKNEMLHHFCDGSSKVVEISDVTWRINVTIMSVNDPPVLEIPQNFVFTPIRNSRTPLPNDIFSARDSDSSSADIIYRALGLGTGLYIENSHSPGRPISSFTQEHIDAKEINFVHAGGPNNARLLLQVSNRDQDTNAARSSTVLRIASVLLQIKVANNTGITLVEGEWFAITSNQLSTQTNANQSIVDVTYTVVDKPKYGEVQVLTGNGETWLVASSFLQSKLEDRKVRYISTDTINSEDDILQDRFAFAVDGCGVTIGPHIFNITILRVKVLLQVNPVVIRSEDDRLLVTEDNISLRYTGLHHVNNEEIQFTISKGFSYAVLSYSRDDRVLSVDDVFTFDDILMDRLHVSVLSRLIPPDLPQLEDSLTLIASVKGRYSSTAASLNLTYIPDVKAIKLTTATLLVDEGGESAIEKENLFAKTLLHDRFTFQVTELPLHGQLVLRHLGTIVNLTNSTKQPENSIFTTGDITEGRLFYRHDGSESDSDHFRFHITPILDGELPETIDQLRGVSSQGFLNISIALLNDNIPIRQVNKPFQVVRNDQRLLTRHDLWYHDPDVHQDDLLINFIRRGMTNGDILSAINQKELFEFSQEDIANNKVLFRHKKGDFGRFVFWVKDDTGTVATGLFIVTASPPFIDLINSSQLVVQKSSIAVISTSNIQASTNVVGLKSSIKYRVTTPPIFGTLCLQNLTSILEFTQQDIDDGSLRYKHGGSPNMKDYFNFTVTAKSETTNGNLQIQVFLASQQQPPVIRRNRVIVVHQSKSVTIERTDLRATHPNVRPRDIIFTIRKPPSYGYFLLNESTSLDENLFVPRFVNNVTTFSQWDVNQNHLIFVQSSNLTFDPVEALDSFTFDVSNGILSQARVVGHIEIVPSTIPLWVSNFSVDEGRSRVLISKYLDISNRHFDDANINLHVIEQPANGMLESSRDPGKRLEEFSFRLAQAEFVYYTHDGSDTLKDSFHLQARTNEGLQSYVVTSHVTIIPDNDQSPEMENNTGMLVWINSITPLPPIALAAVDLDSPASNLTYDILPPQNGHIALASSPTLPIFNFTQENINHRDIVFCHKGSNTGGFTFQVNDGRNFDNKQIFVITARLLVISLTSNTTLQVFPGSLAPVTVSNLHAATNDEKSRDLTFHVTTAPLRGVLLKKISTTNQTSEFTAVDSFTQSQVNLGIIFYNQSEDVVHWNSTDVLLMGISSFPAEEMKDVKLSMNISYDAYLQAHKSSPVRVNNVATVQEGASFNLTLSHLDALNLFNKLDEFQRNRYTLRYRVVRPPLHGRLSVSDRLLATNDSFLHRFIEDRIVNYTHDSSEDSQDFFVFEAYLQHKGQSSRTYPFRIRDIFNISVQPVNDNPPKLITINPHLETVRGFLAFINSSHLQSEDVDNVAADITYNIIQTPKYGKLISSTSKQEVTTFTQEDINENRLCYQQNIGGKTLPTTAEAGFIPDAFYFSLSDGLHKPIYKLFMIKIFPVTIQLMPKPLLMKQGEVASLLSTDQLHISTNGDPYQLSFNLTSSPTAGSLYIGDDQVTSFTYRDLLTSSVTYVMSDITHDRDHMIIKVSYNHASNHVNESAQLNVTIKARMKAGDLQFSSNATHPLTLAALDASELDNFSSSVPVYEIIKAAQYAQIVVKKEPTAHDIVRRDVKRQIFTHDEVASGHVFLVVSSVELENMTSVNDQFVYELGVSDGSVQPVVGVFSFEIIPSKTSEHTSTEYDVTTLIIAGHTEAATAINHTLSPSLMSTSTPVYPQISESSAATVVTTNLVVQNRKDPANEVKESGDSSLPWLIPVIVVLCLLVLIVIAVISFCIVRRRRKHTRQYIRGEESPTLKAFSSLHVPTHQTTIDADTVVKVTSRDDSLEVPQQCPTASVVVTPLRKSPSHLDDADDQYDDGYYADGYSNSMPLEGLLASSGMQGLSLPHDANPPIPSPYGLGDLPQDSLDHYNSLPRSHARHGVISSNESLDSTDLFIPPHPRRNISSGSLPLSNNQLSTPALELNQYWI